MGAIMKNAAGCCGTSKTAREAAAHSASGSQHTLKQRQRSDLNRCQSPENNSEESGPETVCVGDILAVAGKSSIPQRTQRWGTSSRSRCTQHSALAELRTLPRIGMSSPSALNATTPGAERCTSGPCSDVLAIILRSKKRTLTSARCTLLSRLAGAESDTVSTNGALRTFPPKTISGYSRLTHLWFSCDCLPTVAQ